MLKNKSAIKNKLWLGSLTLFAATFLSFSAHAACTSPAGVAGEMYYNTTDDVYEYCDDTNWVDAVHERHGSDPTIAGSVVSSGDLGSAGDVVVAGDYAYVANFANDEFTVVDISDPTSPSVVGSVTSSTQLNGASSVAIQGNRAYVTAYLDDELTIIDISIPSSPTIIDSISSSTQLDGADGVVVAADYAYVAASFNNRLTVVDIDETDGSFPSIVGSVNDNTQLSGVRDLAISGDYVYLTAEKFTSAGRLTVVDISTPSSPSIAGSVTSTTLNSPNGVAVRGDYAYVASTANDRLTVVDVSTPSSPSVSGSVTDGTQLDFIREVAVYGNYAFAASSTADSLAVIDVSTPASPSIVGYISDGTDLDFVQDVFVQGNYAYMTSDTRNSLIVLDIANAFSYGTCSATGQMFYNSTNRVMEYCNGSELVPMGPDVTDPGTTDLQAHWELDEGSGTTVDDSTGNTDNDGVFVGTPTWSTGVVGSGSLLFDYAEEINLPDSHNVGGVSHIDTFGGGLENAARGGSKHIASFSVWFQITRSSSATDWDPIFGQLAGISYASMRNGTDPNREWQFMFRNDDHDTSNVFPRYSEPFNYANTWVHAVLVVEDKVGYKLYYDGVLVQELFDERINLGHWGQDGWFGYLQGYIDDLRVYSRALTEAEVLHLYGLGSTSGCASPAGVEGEMQYSSTDNAMQYCNGVGWVSIGK